MRIAIEAWAAEEVPAGRGRYVRELLAAWAALDDNNNEVVLLARRPWDGLVLPPRWSWRLIETAGRPWLGRAAMAARSCDVMMATTSYALLALAAALGTQSAGFVHDLIAFDPSLGPPRGAAFERLTLPPAVRSAVHLFCNSEATRGQLVSRHPTAETKSSVTWLAAGASFAKAHPDAQVEIRHGLLHPYVLSAATLEPRKNLPRLMDAFASLGSSVRRDVELVLVGGRGWRSAEIEAAIARHRGSVRLLGHVSDDDLAALYAGATVVAYPSLEEGFGLPVLEAMAAGAPVLTSNRSSLPEVAGTAALLIDPTDTRAIAAGLEQLLDDADLRARLSAAGRERARDFSWSTTARLTRDRLVAAVT